MGTKLRLAQISVGAIASTCALIASAAAPAAASTLAGQTFEANNSQGGKLSVNCGPSKFAPFTYRAQGLAIGPHSGTFTEQGRVVPTSVGSALVDLDARFTIRSPDGGNVSGEKHFVAGSGGVASCTRSDPGNPPAWAATNLRYTAKFAQGGKETGRTNLGGADNPAFFNFNEQFLGPSSC